MNSLFMFACIFLFVNADNSVRPTNETVKCCNSDNITGEIKTLVAEMRKQQLSIQALETIVQKQHLSLEALKTISQKQQVSFQALVTIGQKQQVSVQALESVISQRINILDAKITSFANDSQEACQKIDVYLRNKVNAVDKVDKGGKGDKVDYVCPSGFVKDGNSCYTFNVNKVNWKTASTLCRGNGSHLVTINSKEEQTFLQNNIQSIKNKKGSKWWWLGGHDRLREGNWVWEATGGKIGAGGSYTNWFPGEPNDHEHEEDCLLLLGQHVQYKWNDEGCDTKCNFICEFKQDPGKTNS